MRARSCRPIRSWRTSGFLAALVVPAALLSVAGCQQEDAPPDSAEVLAHMRDHFMQASDLQRAVVNGDMEGIDEVRVLIRRLSGAYGDWRRANRRFLKDVRKQFLIWRALPQETMEIYRQRTLVALGEAQSNA